MLGTEVGTSKNQSSHNKVVWEGVVVDILDGEENGAIKVRIPELDKNTVDADLPICYPLFNFSFFRVLPKVGERVTIMNRNIYESLNSNNKDIRYWVSVVHSNVYNIENQPFFLDSDANKSDSPSKPPKKIKTIPEAKGILPNPNDISISGRNNSGIVLKDSEVLINSGLHEQTDNLKFNKKNPSYISIRFPKDTKIVSTKKQSKSTPTFIPPKNTITVQTTNNSGTIQVKDKLNEKVLLSQVFSKKNRTELFFAIKSALLLVQSQFPYWELITFDNELEGLPKIYGTGDNGVISQELILDNKTFNLSNILSVSDKIFLVSHLNGQFNLKKQPDLFDEQDIINLSDNGHPIPYGDKLVELLELVRLVLTNHVHPYDGMKTVQEEMVQKLLNFDLNSILNKNVLTG